MISKSDRNDFVITNPHGYHSTFLSDYHMNQDRVNNSVRMDISLLALALICKVYGCKTESDDGRYNKYTLSYNIHDCVVLTGYKIEMTMCDKYDIMNIVGIFTNE